MIGAVSAKGDSPDLATTFIVNNKSISSPLNNVTAPLAQIPAGDPTTDPSVKWFDEADGTTSALTVPANASGAILVDGPSKFTIESDLSGNADGSNPFPTVLTCSAPAGEDLSMARIQVVPTGAQTIDVTTSYICNIWGALQSRGLSSVPADGTAANNLGLTTTDEIKFTLPSAVTPGGTIASTDVTDTWDLPAATLGTLNLQPGVFAGIQGTVSGSLGVHVDGRTSTAPLNDVTTPLTPIPPAVPFLLPSTGTSSAISIPADATGTVTISAPQELEIDYQTVAADTTQHSTNLNGMLCVAADDQDLTLATVNITQPPAHAALTAANPKSSVFGNPVAVPVGASVPTATPKPITAGGTQSIDATRVYTCNVWTNQTSVPTDGTPPTETPGSPPDASEETVLDFKATLPASVNPGDTIPSTDASVQWSVPLGSGLDFGATNAESKGQTAGVDQVSLPDYTLGVVADGQTSSASVANLANPALTPIAPEITETFTEPPPIGTLTQTVPGPWPVQAQGSISAITVPAGTKSDLTIQAPQQIEIDFTAEPNDAGTTAGDTPTPVAMQCSTVDPLTIATVDVNQPPKPITHPVPTGKVLIMRGNKGVAQGTLVKGKANVVIPGTALPVGRSTLTVKYTGDSNTLAAPNKTITVVKTKASPSLAVHVTPGKVAAGAVFPTVNVKLTGPGKAKGGKVTVTAEGISKSTNLLSLDGTGSVQLPPFATAGHKVIRVSYAGNANFVAKTVTAGLNVTKTGLGKFVVKVKPGKIIAKKTRATLLITLGAPDKLNHGLVTVRLAGRVIAKKLINGTGKITLPKFPSAGRKLLHLTFAGNASVVSRTITKPVKVTKPARHHRK